MKFACFSAALLTVASVMDRHHLAAAVQIDSQPAPVDGAFGQDETLFGLSQADTIQGDESGSGLSQTWTDLPL